MLILLSIRNYAIAESLDIELSAGMTAITGETGAGKSIILGAMSLILGDRADRDAIRSGCDRADITAEFDVSRLTAARQWLADNALDSDHPDQCLIRRSVSADGRSRAWINGAPVTLQSLAELGALLMDIHSQHEHHSLLKKATHQQLLDDYAGHAPATTRLRELAEQWRQTHKELESLLNDSNEQSAQLELARYQLEELDQLNLQDDELDSLDQELDELTHAESRLAKLQALLQLCREDDEANIVQMLQHSQALAAECGQSSALQNIQDMLSTALIQVEEAASEINRHLDSIEINPERLNEVNERLGQIHQLARKHKVRPESLVEMRAQLQQQLQSQASSAEAITHLQEAADRLQREWQDQASQISAARSKAADLLSEAVNQQLAALAMPDARLSVELVAQDSTHPQPFGLEQAEFLISTNTGQSAKPLAKIASGGELSRISLAIQVITAMTSDTPTLVFDEVDVGIGGSVARTVGRLLKQLGARSQVLCVTHQPLVASQANQHLFVSKQTQGNQTQSSVSLLEEEDRLTEIARMLGGDSGSKGRPSEESLAHARELTAISTS